MVEIIVVGVAASAGYILAGILFFMAGVLFYTSSKSGLARLLNTQEKMLTILIETSEILFLMALFGLLFEITGNLTFRTLSHVALYSASLLLLIATYFDYKERKAQRIKDTAEIKARRKKMGVIK